MPKPTTLILILLCVSTGPTIFRLGSGAGCPSFCVVLIHGPTLANVTTSKSTSMDKMIGNDRLAMALQTKTVREPELTQFFDNNIPILRAEYGRRLRGSPSSTALVVRDQGDGIGKPKTPKAFLHPFDPFPYTYKAHQDMGIYLLLIYLPFSLGIVWFLCNMVQGHHGHGMERGNPQLVQGSFNYRIPPYWDPIFENAHGSNQYTFRAYMTDLSLWIMLTDLEPWRQCAAIIMRLGGAAREFGRGITPQEMSTGGILNGDQVDPVTFVIGSLHARFAPLEEESRLQSMTEMWAFARRPGEGINALLSRYEQIRARAANEGQFVMSIEGCSLQLLRAVGIRPNHLYTLLQPFEGQLPRTEREFSRMCQ